MSKNSPLLSVITVVYNDEKNIERTIKSVVNQTYPYVEYIVIDGASKDGTINIVNKYRDQITKIVSEPDKGIYDAMNKAMKIATGDYLLFMNSGDEIYRSDTVEKLFSLSPDADIYYGETEMINDNLESLGRRRHQAPENFSWKSFKYGMSICHQAIYVKRTLAEPYNNKSYQLSADIDWILNIAKKSRKIINGHSYVAKYLVGGMSKKKHWQSLKERYLILKKYYGFIPNLFNHIIIAFNLAFYWLKNKRTND
ncbi:glycosyl transferase family 2 [Pseudopedobacter saltans DSM 12145]|uniref:Glycosyl transferase family 2 n=1 Tax=Pseudopedobacter saltans (strain ATCC 51119 / DSM 12145 / JCM 21818 / CCUG 39354 / LMG 10337 / NBRC 100064 / NCIMB 13643) TaxID=762903 RepID=F0SBB4_PSESL|nr:glycosyltransferase family 2 protein [Pseudopedobacter saltans]ADY53741.1 glycosyl transferase family 2 [Pseudopedobacter saltans DSM 12145]